MGLSLHERRVIADIERSLSREDPGLAGMLADFGQAHPEPIRPAARPAPPVEPLPYLDPPPPPGEPPPPDDRAETKRIRRAIAWSIALALTLLSAALALSEAGLLVAAVAAALAGFVFWAVSRKERRRRVDGPLGPGRGG